MCQNNSAKIYSEKILTVCNAVYFRLCIDLMHITQPVTAEDMMAPITRGMLNETVHCIVMNQLNMSRVLTKGDLMHLRDALYSERHHLIMDP